MLQSLKHLRDSKNCSDYKKIVKLTIQLSVGKGSLSIESSLQLEDSETPQATGEEESLSGLHTGDLLKDAKFYQDIAIELQTAYKTLESRFTQQARLMKEASGALHAAESQASKRQQELLGLQKDREADHPIGCWQSGL